MSDPFNAGEVVQIKLSLIEISNKINNFIELYAKDVHFREVFDEDRVIRINNIEKDIETLKEARWKMIGIVAAISFVMPFLSAIILRMVFKS